MCVGIHVLRHIKVELAWGTYRWLRVISNIMLFKSYTTKKLKNKAILSLNNIAKWSLVTYSNCLVIYN